MELTENVGAALVKGRIGLCRIRYRRSDRKQIRQVEPLFSKPNQIQISWGAIATQCIGLGDRKYRINAMYLEYENVADPDDIVTVPTFERGDGREYYHDLIFTGNRDFLRVPLSLTPGISIEQGYEDFFTPGVDGNRLTFYTQSQGTSGFNGKPFSAGVNSKLFGVALVATPDYNDATKDIVFARSYFETGDQTLKMASSQFGVTWDIVFK